MQGTNGCTIHTLPGEIYLVWHAVGCHGQYVVVCGTCQYGGEVIIYYMYITA